MQIRGLNKTTLLDYPEHVAATIFTGGCNFCCPFCHNGDLVLRPGEVPPISQEEVLEFLRKRKGVLSGVCITGGEPTLQSDLIPFIREVKELGYLVKVDTNGYRPDVLRRLLEEGLADYVAMDIKNTREKYALTAGKAELEIARIEESVALLKEERVPCEFRTTVVKELHGEEDLLEIGRWICGARAYFLQPYRDNENVIAKSVSGQDFSGWEDEELKRILLLLRQYVRRVELRGTD